MVISRDEAENTCPEEAKSILKEIEDFIDQELVRKALPRRDSQTIELDFSSYFKKMSPDERDKYWLKIVELIISRYHQEDWMVSFNMFTGKFEFKKSARFRRYQHR